MRYYGMFVLALTLGVTSYSEYLEEIPVLGGLTSYSDEDINDYTVEIVINEHTSEEIRGSLIEELKDLGVRSFDPAVNRPIIRGLGGYRVKVLEPLREPSRIQDLEPPRIQHLYDAEKIEVLRGPRGLEDLSYPDPGVEKIEVLPDVERNEDLRGPRGELGGLGVRELLNTNSPTTEEIIVPLIPGATPIIELSPVSEIEIDNEKLIELQDMGRVEVPKVSPGELFLGGDLEPQE